MATEKNTALAKAGVIEILVIMNELARLDHPATALTALQGAVAAVLNHYRIPSEMFMARVDRTRVTLVDQLEDDKRG